MFFHSLQPLASISAPVILNKHKPWIETSYHGVITENMDTVLLDPPLVALDKDAPVPYAGMNSGNAAVDLERKSVMLDRRASSCARPLQHLNQLGGPEGGLVLSSEQGKMAAIIDVSVVLFYLRGLPP
ncbi:unnamed protein product [Pleuronectes platessa]|uniref:Uncharacterized protein n=1 Tax=Pleuronectes platessa TaxID=8262 RepID=A0A9N7VRA1_PLEPL|nr:unnamed protein product [Pleuronectes platessa]